MRLTQWCGHVQEQAPCKVADGDEQLPLTAPDQEPASAEDAHPRNFERAAQMEHRDEARAMRAIISTEVGSLLAWLDAWLGPSHGAQAVLHT